MADKRVPMGEIAGRMADVAIVTNDNPRGEPPEAIAATVASGCARGTARTDIILDRGDAIARALDQARAGDVVVIAGKGHESIQDVGGRKLAFGDADHVRRLLHGRGPSEP
jgi:UDP-N-acetylmuramoyl-L-alanyl-D-glutamate--2,6-diaminopimelate ligase